MSLRDGPIGDAKAPLMWIAAVGLAVAAVAAIALLLADRTTGDHARAFTGPSRAVDAMASPVGGALSAPIQGLGALAGGVSDYFFAASQNHKLKLELDQALKWRDEALALRLENARFRALMGVKTDPPLPMVLGRVTLDARGPFSNTRLVDVGADRGVIEGNPVLSDHGLVGRVVGVAPGVSRVLLLTDVESRIPVLIARTNGRAILTGDGGPNPQLAYLRTHDAMREGDRILTSGDGGVLPRGLPVGSASKGYDGLWRVALDSDAEPIDWVQILLFRDFSQLIPAGALALRTLPPAATEPPAAINPPAPAPPMPTPMPTGAPSAQAKAAPKAGSKAGPKGAQ